MADRPGRCVLCDGDHYGTGRYCKACIIEHQGDDFHPSDQGPDVDDDRDNEHADRAADAYERALERLVDRGM